MLTKGQEYNDQRQDCYEECYRERVLRAPAQRAVTLGMQMVPITRLSDNRNWPEKQIADH